MHIIAHNLQQGPSTGQSVNPETIEAGNVQITIQHKDRDMAITIAKGEEKNDEAEVSPSTGQKKKSTTNKDTAATTESRKKSPKKKSPKKK